MITIVKKSSSERNFREYLSRFIDDYDNDNYERLIASYPILREDYMNALCSDTKRLGKG